MSSNIEGRKRYEKDVAVLKTPEITLMNESLRYFVGKAKLKKNRNHNTCK